MGATQSIITLKQLDLLTKRPKQPVQSNEILRNRSGDRQNKAMQSLVIPGGNTISASQLLSLVKENETVYCNHKFADLLAEQYLDRLSQDQLSAPLVSQDWISFLRNSSEMEHIAELIESHDGETLVEKCEQQLFVIPFYYHKYQQKVVNIFASSWDESEMEMSAHPSIDLLLKIQKSTNQWLSSSSEDMKINLAVGDQKLLMQALQYVTQSLSFIEKIYQVLNALEFRGRRSATWLAMRRFTVEVLDRVLSEATSKFPDLPSSPPTAECMGLLHSLYSSALAVLLSSSYLDFVKLVKYWLLPSLALDLDERDTILEKQSALIAEKAKAESDLEARKKKEHEAATAPIGQPFKASDLPKVETIVSKLIPFKQPSSNYINLYRVTAADYLVPEMVRLEAIIISNKGLTDLTRKCNLDFYSSRMESSLSLLSKYKGNCVMLASRFEKIKMAITFLSSSQTFSGTLSSSTELSHLLDSDRVKKAYQTLDRKRPQLLLPDHMDGESSYAKEWTNAETIVHILAQAQQSDEIAKAIKKKSGAFGKYKQAQRTIERVHEYFSHLCQLSELSVLISQKVRLDDCNYERIRKFWTCFKLLVEKTIATIDSTMIDNWTTKKSRFYSKMIVYIEETVAPMMEGILQSWLLPALLTDQHEYSEK